MTAGFYGINTMEQEAVYRMRELFAQGREATMQAAGTTEEEQLRKWSELALYPEKPLLSFKREEQEEEEPEYTWYPGQSDMEFFRLAETFRSKQCVRKLIACGGVDDGKSTLIGRIFFDAMDQSGQAAIRENPDYLRADKSIDYALLAGTTEEEARQGITVQVSYSTFEWGACSFLMADVPGHEEYTRNMAFAASGADMAVIMVAANKGIVPQTRRHTRICHFMGIRRLVFAVNKMDMASFCQKAFEQLSQEVAHLMEEYPDCTYQIVPVAAKSGVNIVSKAKEMPWYTGGTLLEALNQGTGRHTKGQGAFCMQVQRICKSSQMKGAVVSKRVFQGPILSGNLQEGEEVFIYPTGKRARVAGIYALDRRMKEADMGAPIGVELDRDLDVARGAILAQGDIFESTDRIEADILWTSDNRLTQGKRYRAQIGTVSVTAVVTKICYQKDVNTGEHRYAEYLTKNALARCELCFPRPVTVACEKDNRTLGTVLLLDRTERSLAAYGNIVHTIAEAAWQEDGRRVLASERESALGQKAGMILFTAGENTEEQINYAERYLLRMGFHTVQAKAVDSDCRDMSMIRSFLDAGLIVLCMVDSSLQGMVTDLLEDAGRVFGCEKTSELSADAGGVFKQMKQWASALI